MTGFNAYMHQSGRATAGNAAAAASSCPQSRRAFYIGLVMDAAFVAASIFVMALLAGLLGLVSVAVSILVLVCLISLLIMKQPQRLRKVNPAA